MSLTIYGLRKLRILTITVAQSTGSCDVCICPDSDRKERDEMAPRETRAPRPRHSCIVLRDHSKAALSSSILSDFKSVSFAFCKRPSTGTYVVSVSPGD